MTTAVQEDPWALENVWAYYKGNAEKTLRQAIVNFNEYNNADPRIEPYFRYVMVPVAGGGWAPRTVNRKDLAEHQYQVVAFICGGPSKFESLDEVVAALVRAHKNVRHAVTGRGIDNGVYYIVGFHLTRALIDAGVDQNFTAKLFGLWDSLSEHVVAKEYQIKP